MLDSIASLLVTSPGKKFEGADEQAGSGRPDFNSDKALDDSGCSSDVKMSDVFSSLFKAMHIFS